MVAYVIKLVLNLSQSSPYLDNSASVPNVSLLIAIFQGLPLPRIVFNNRSIIGAFVLQFVQISNCASTGNVFIYSTIGAKRLLAVGSPPKKLNTILPLSVDTQRLNVSKSRSVPSSRIGTPSS